MWGANHPSAGQTNPATQVYTYDELNRLVAMTQPWGEAGTAVTTYAYDVQDHLAAVTDAEGNVTTYETSNRDLPIRETSEVTGVTTYVYNEHSELTHETDARGVTVTRSVDELDRVKFVDYPGDALDVAYTYDDPAVSFSVGRLTRIARKCGARFRDEPMAHGCEQLFYGNECQFQIPEKHKRCPNPCVGS